jgi:hypothetical protein
MQKTIMICDRCQSMYDKHENKVKSVTVSFPHGAEVPASYDRCFPRIFVRHARALWWGS